MSRRTNEYYGKPAYTHFIRRSEGTSMVQYALLLCVVVLFGMGFTFLAKSVRQVHANLAAQTNEATAAGTIAGNSLTGKTDSLTTISLSHSVVTLENGIWSVGLGFIGLVAMLFWNLARRKRFSLFSNDKTDDTSVISLAPFSIQVQLFHKRQQMLHLFMKDRDTLWKNRLLVRHLMTSNVLTVPPITPISTIVQVMKEKQLHHVLVCEHEKELLGVISDRDLCKPGATTAKDLMSPRLFTIGPDTPLSPAISSMINEHISCLPVVEEGKLLGIITTTDLMLALQCSLQIWDQLAELIHKENTGSWEHELGELQLELAQHYLVLDNTISDLGGSNKNQTSPEVVTILENVQEIFHTIRELTGKIDQYRYRFLECVKSLQKVVDF